MKDNEFKNVFEDSNFNNFHFFRKNFVTPFISGVLGCCITLSACFGIPSIKQKIVGTANTPTSISNFKNANDSNQSSLVNTDLVSLNNYSDTAVYAARKNFTINCRYYNYI